MVDIYIASLWRGGHLAKTINSLMKNPEVASITAVCNHYTDFQIGIINATIKHNEKVVLIKGDNLKGCDERFKFVNLGKSDYIAICDDDLIYPPDYLKTGIEAIEKHNTLISFHGRILKKAKATNYYKHADKVFHCLRDVDSDTEVDIVGAGACIFRRDLFDINKLYGQIKYPNMGDIYLSYIVKRAGLKRIVIKHKAGWITHKEIEPTDNYIYDNCKNDCKIQTDFINKLFLGYDK